MCGSSSLNFVTKYKNTKTDEDLSPSTWRSYITSAQLAFKHEWGYNISLLSNPVFACPRLGLLSVLKNEAQEQQRQGKHTVFHNTLSREELQELFRSSSLSRDSSARFLACLVFKIGLLTGMHRMAMSTLSVVLDMVRSQVCR